MTTDLDRDEARIRQAFAEFTVDRHTVADLNPESLFARHEQWERHRKSRRQHAVLIAAVFVLIASGALASVLTISGTSKPKRSVANGPTRPTAHPILVGGRIVLTSEDESEMQALLAKYEAEPGVSRAAAKLVPYSDVGFIPGVRGGSPVASPPSLVVAIALSGELQVIPPGAKLPNGQPLPDDQVEYKLLVIDPSTGAVLDDTGGGPEEWPAGFDALPDLPPGSVVPTPAALQLGPSDNGKTYEMAPSSTISIDLPGSATSAWTLPPTPPVDSPVLVETDATNVAGTLVSYWTAAIDGTQTISSTSGCNGSQSDVCMQWSVTILVRG